MKNQHLNSARLTSGKLKKILQRFSLVSILLLFASYCFAQQQNIRGTVKYSDGEEIIGATIQIKGTGRGTITDITGGYNIMVEPQEVLVFSYVGMVTQEITVGGQRVIDIILEPDIEVLDEVVIVAYGVQEKASVVGAISQVSGDVIRKVNTGGSVENTLQGRIPGLNIIGRNATPGEEAISYYGADGLQMSVRGLTAMGNNSPLLIVDGVERPFSNLDPNEIADISVLKDASATAVYGVKGANGVIIVTTKRGRTGAIQLEFSSQLSVKTPTVLPTYLDAYETLSLRNIAAKNDQRWDYIVPDDILQKYRDQSEPYLYRNFDWMDFYFKPGFDQTYNINARGGNDFVRYFVSLGYLNEGDIFTTGDKVPYTYDKHNASYYHNRYTFRNNLDFTLTPSTTLAINLGGNVREYGKPIDTFTQERWFQSVTDFPYYPEEALEQYPDTKIPWDQGVRRPFVDPNTVPATGRLMWEGGLGFWRHKANETSVDLNLQQKLDFITKGLAVSGLFSYNNSAIYRQEYSLPAFYAYYLNSETKEWTRHHGEGELDYNTPPPNMRVLNDQIFMSARSFYYQGRVNYARTFNKVHNVTAMGLFSRRKSQGTSDFPHYEENWVGRATYDYDTRYLFEASVSHTGSEKFAPGLRFGTFPSFAGGWNVSNERFFEPAKDIINNLKLRYSWGQVGNDGGIARWLYRSEYSEDGGNAIFGYPTLSYPFISEGPIPVTNATWEKASLRDLGIEMGLFNNFITLEVDLFDEYRSNMLQSRNRVPSWVGVSSIQSNIGEAKSHGIEVTLGVQHQFANGLHLYFNGSFSGTESRVVYWDESEFIPDHLKAEGKPVSLARRMWSRGVLDQGYYNNFDDLFLYPQRVDKKPIVGDLKYIDFDGNGLIDAEDGVVGEYPWEPERFYNGTFGGNYKNWSLEFSVYGISNTQRMVRGGGEFFLFPFTQQRNNAYEVHADHWRPDNISPSFPTPHFEANNHYNYYNTQFAMLDGQYFRLKHVRLAYRFEDLFSKLGVSNVELSLIGNNLYTWRKREWGGDPEGFNFGEDFGSYPHMKRYSLEIRVAF